MKAFDRHFSICPQWLRTKVSPSLHSQPDGRSGILRR